MKAIVNGRIVLKDRILDNSAVLYSDIIEGIVPSDKLSDGCEIIDANGGFITPGFIDLHIHGYLGKDVCDGEEESIRAISKGIISNGVRHATHLFNAMTPMAHRAPGVVGAALNSDVSCELIVDTFHVLPALYDLAYKMKGRKLCFITDCLPAGGLPYGEYTLGGNKIIYRDIVCRLEDGTVAGSVLKLNKGCGMCITTHQSRSGSA